MQNKDLISITDMRSEDIQVLLTDALNMRNENNLNLLANKTLALLFEKPSWRTRVSFEIAMQQLGGRTICLSAAELPLGKRESLQDTARVLGRYINVMAVRSFSHTTVTALGEYAEIPVINALDEVEHPCQALGDLLTMLQKKDYLKGLEVAYIGEGNHVLNSLILACALMGINFRMAAPAGYQVSEPVLDLAREFALGSRAEIRCTASPQEAAAGADVVYTDVWTTFNREDAVEEQRRVFRDYRIDRAVMAAARPDAIFMHPLPAHHGEEVEDEVFYGPQSVVFDQAENSLHIQKALLAEMLGGLDIYLRRHQ